ncbi:MAG: 3-deoxy-D-manno-octulosonic acid transferase [Candidatus Methylomirabilales bacterium]
MRYLYSIALFFGLLPYLPGLLRRLSRSGPFGLGLRERLGQYPEALTVRLQGKHPLWLHSVSVGEAVVGSILVSRLRARCPGLPLLVSTVTATGRQVAQERIPQAEGFIYFPLDFPGPVARALTVVNPRLVLLTEGEIWPNFLDSCHSRKIPVLLVNGRVSRRSFQRYQLVKPLFRRVLGRIALFCMRGEVDAERILGLGADPKRVVVTGNIKYDDEGADSQIPPHLVTMARLMNGRPVWVAGSTHRGEEDLILQAFREVYRHTPETVLILAPRHPERVPEVETLLQGGGLPFVRRTRLGETGSRLPPVILVDTMGELSHLYALASVVFVGGSLVPAGGHNVLEPARYRRPILFGPHMENFAEIAEAFLVEGRAPQVHDTAELAARVLEIFHDPSAASRMGEAAYRVLARNRGAAERTVTLIERYL